MVLDGGGGHLLSQSLFYFLNDKLPSGSEPNKRRQSSLLPTMEIDADQESLEYEPTVYSTESGTPAPSVYSYASSRDGRALLREIGGRTLNAKNELYLLPAGMFRRCP